MIANPKKRLSLQEIIKQCKEESKKYKFLQPDEKGFCMELLRRATEDDDQDAWEGFYNQYKGLISSWVGFDDNTEDHLQMAFVKFFKSVKTRKFILPENISEALSFLKRCAVSVKINALRDAKKRVSQVSLEEYNELYDEISSDSTGDHQPDVQIERKDNVHRLLNLCERHLQDEPERVVFRDSFLYGLSPQQVLDRNGGIFADVQEVRRIKERILLRFHRSDECKKLMKLV